MAKGTNTLAHAILIDMHEQLETLFTRLRIAKLNHLPKLPCRINMQKGERRWSGIECLHRQMQHHRRILADRIKHYRVGKTCRDLAKNMDSFRLKALKMRQVLGQGCMMHD